MARLARKKKVKAFSPTSASRKELDNGATLQFEGKKYPDYVAMGDKYADLVATEKIPACRYLIQAAKRYQTMRAQAGKPGSEYYWSDVHAVEVCAFIEELTHVKGVLAKEKFILEPWQLWILIAIYGFRWRDTGDRVVTIAMLEVTRKSGKSLLAAGIALYELGPNAHIGDDLFIIAPTEALAKKVLEPMRSMVDNDTGLQSFYQVSHTQKKMDFGVTESYAIILPASGKKQDGHDPKVVIADEFHSLPGAIFSVMKSSQGARPESLFLEIGSAGYSTFGVGWDERQGAIEVLEGKSDRPELFVALYTIDPEDFGNWRSERVIRKANPNAGISNPMRKLKQEVEAIYENPRNRAEALRTRFNVWGLGEARLISQQQWKDCLDPELSIASFDKQKAWVGVDLATRNDMVSWTIIFERDNILYCFARHYVPEYGPWREDEEVSALYVDWNEQDYLVFTPGSYHTYDEIYIDLLQICEQFDVEAIVVDDREANALMAALDRDKKPVISLRKNATNFSEPTKDIVAKAVGKTKGIHHGGNPVLAWNVSNVIGATNTAGLILPKKETEHSEKKIDGFDALVQANAARMEHITLKPPRPVNPMAERGVRIL